jgi:GNAT superfamily N-acetyltransferase
MRLSVFIPQKSTQLLIDLRKIYQDYFTPQQLSDESLTALIEQPDSQLYATMFNGRHLGSIQVTVNNTEAILSLLTVRDLTRRRGVAKNLLREVEKQLKSEGVKTLKMDSSKILTEEKNGLELFMQANGYQLKENSLIKSL